MYNGNTEIFNVDTYKDNLSKFLLKNNFNKTDSELDIIKKFETWLNCFLKKVGYIKEDENFILKSEVKHSRWKADSVYRNVIIEYKKYDKLSSKTILEKAEDQLIKKYILDCKYNGVIVYGFLFDGKNIYAFKKDENQNIRHIDKFSGLLNYNNLDNFIRTLLLINSKELSPQGLKNDFSLLNNDRETNSKRLFIALNNIIQDNISNRTKLLIKEWEKLFKLSESDNGKHKDIEYRRKDLTYLSTIEINTAEKEYKALFALHTTFSIIVKLLIIKIIEFIKINDRTYNFSELFNLDLINLKSIFKETEKGTVFKQNYLINMIEGDFFSWYCEEDWNKELEDSIKGILIDLSIYEDIGIKKYNVIQDLFRDLYENFIPASIRHSFGEYYTPYWLADCVITNAIKNTDNENFKILDPCCGSGTFLMCALEKITKDDNVNISDIRKRVVGIDLNPLAILVAKANYFINIYNYWDKKTKIEIPIYLGDSTYTPTTINKEGIDCITYDLVTSNILDHSIEITLPYEFVALENFISIMEELEFYIIRKEKDKSFNFLISKIDKKYLNNSIEVDINKLIDDLIHLEKNNLNSIWLRIFANYLKTGVLNSFDIIAGNPPWVSWGILPEKYREKVKSKCKFDGLFSNDKNTGGNNLNVCALIANKSTEKWLKDGGILSFLMPKSILFNKSYEGFRNFTIKNKKLYLQEVMDFEYAGKPFENVSLPFCNFVYSDIIKDYCKGIILKEFVKNKGVILTRHMTYNSVKENFLVNIKYVCYFPHKNNNNFTIIPTKDYIEKINPYVGELEYNFRKGVGSKGEVFRLKFIKDIDNTYAVFKLYKKVKNRLEVSDKYLKLEKNFIKPYVISPMINDYECKWDNLYHIFPYYEGDKKPLDEKVLKEKAPEIYKYLLSKYNILKSSSSYNIRIQNTKEFYGIIRVGYYSYSDHFVAIRDNTKLTASYIGKIKTHWGEYKVPLLDNHISYISEKKGTNDFISRKEAKYIINILNNKFVKYYVENSSDLRSIGTKFPIKITKYKKYT